MKHVTLLQLDRPLNIVPLRVLPLREAGFLKLHNAPQTGFFEPQTSTGCFFARGMVILRPAL